MLTKNINGFGSYTAGVGDYFKSRWRYAYAFLCRCYKKQKGPRQDQHAGAKSEMFHLSSIAALGAGNAVGDDSGIITLRNGKGVIERQDELERHYVGIDVVSVVSIRKGRTRFAAHRGGARA